MKEFEEGYLFNREDAQTGAEATQGDMVISPMEMTADTAAKDAQSSATEGAADSIHVDSANEPMGSIHVDSANEPMESIHVDSAEESADTLHIDLSGSAAPKPKFMPGVVGDAFYREDLQRMQAKAKKDGKKRFVAAVAAIAVLNLAVFGGAYTLGRSAGERGHAASSKSELISSLSGARDDNTNKVVETGAREGEMATTEIAKQVGPAVVGITGTIENNGYMSIFGGSTTSMSQGSGIILSQDGYVVTNNHVVEDASAIKVVLNTGSEYDAQVVGADAETDLAVIKIEPKEELTVAKLGDSSALEVGERVVAIGNPMGVEFFGSVTQGIVSAVNRSISVDNRTMNLIQTDAAINSGNSGGALINAYGEVIGINSVKVSSTGVEGMGFAIPISEANPIIADLLEHGYVKGRPVIGISTRDVSAYMAQSYSWPMGVQVMDINSQSARDAGLAQGDIITAVNGEKVQNGKELNRIKDQHAPGDVLKLEVYKYTTGQTETVEVTLSEQIPG